MDIKEMMNFVKGIEFIDEDHKEKFNELMKNDNARDTDVERKALFYIVSGNEELYFQRDKIYNFKSHQIELGNYIEGKIMLSGGTNRMLYLAYHLYNGFNFERIDENKKDYELSINDIFSGIDIKGYKVCINALNIRFGRMK
ncbi:DUF6075 family protein [Clostridium saccharoperbutylacetonicum]|uniref:DUF6075 family protein n=1 Tax=Clostridium saccharoperbutylacetonicum TaxID=36745 RepID=UPI0039ED0816